MEKKGSFKHLLHVILQTSDTCELFVPILLVPFYQANIC